MTSIVTWKKFQFFTKSPETIDAFQKNGHCTISCCFSGYGKCLFGDISGKVHIYQDQKFIQAPISLPLSTFRVDFIHLLNSNYLVAVSNDNSAIPWLRVYNLEKCVAQVQRSGSSINTVSFTQSFKLSNAPCRITCFEEKDESIYMGTDKGTVLLMRGNIIKEKQLKVRVIYDETSTASHDSVSSSSYITCIKAVGQGVFVSTESHVLFLGETGGIVTNSKVVDPFGTNPNCCVIRGLDELLAARNDAIYILDREIGRKSCFLLEGQKSMLQAWKQDCYISVSNGKRGTSGNMTSYVSIFDLSNSILSYSAQFEDEVKFAFANYGNLYLLLGDNSLVVLNEMDIRSKLECLYSRNLYRLAISLIGKYNDSVEQSSSNAGSLLDVKQVHKKYADYLFSKGNFDEATEQYIMCIGGSMQPSYVIRKLLDVQRLGNLTLFLQSLHSEGHANADHTTLLIHCYTKLGDETKLDEFIKTDKQYEFDVKAAISVCRQSGYYKHALYLAEHAQEHDCCLKVLLEDMQDYRGALNYIKQMYFFESEKLMKKYGKKLMDHEPHETTQYLVKLCTELKPRLNHVKRESNDQESSRPFSEPIDTETFIDMFVGKPGFLLTFLSSVLEKSTDKAFGKVFYHTLFEIYLQQSNNVCDKADPGESAKSKAITSKKAAKASTTNKTGGSLKKAIAVTPKDDSDAVNDYREQALQLLASIDAQYDIDQVLVLCKNYNFSRGLLYIYEKQHAYGDILQHYMENGENELILTLSRNLVKEPNLNKSLWFQVLSYFGGSSMENGKSFGNHVNAILDLIDEHDLLTPTEVVEVMARNKTAPLSLIKRYILKKIQRENDLTDENYRLLCQYKEETKKLEADIKELESLRHTFQSMNCDLCQNRLDLPAVHFFCKHSYHQRCISTREECPKCLPLYEKIMGETRSNLEKVSISPDKFMQILDDNPSDGFKIMTEYFGRNPFIPLNEHFI